MNPHSFPAASSPWPPCGSRSPWSNPTPPPHSHRPGALASLLGLDQAHPPVASASPRRPPRGLAPRAVVFAAVLPPRRPTAVSLRPFADLSGKALQHAVLRSPRRLVCDGGVHPWNAPTAAQRCRPGAGPATPSPLSSPFHPSTYFPPPPHP